MKNFIKSLWEKTYRVLFGILAWIGIFGFCMIYMPLVFIIQGLLIPIEQIINIIRLRRLVGSYEYFACLLQKFKLYSDIGEEMEENLIDQTESEEL